MSHFLFTLGVLILCACVAVSFLSPPHSPVFSAPGGHAGLPSWRDVPLALGLVVARASAAELCFAYSCNGFDCPFTYCGESGGWGFQTVADSTSCQGDYHWDHVWSISSSSTDPRANVGELPPNRQLFLWLVQDNFGSPHCGGYGYEADILRFRGDLSITGYEPIVGTGAVFRRGALWVADGGCIPCVNPSNPLLVGKLTVSSTVSVDEAGSWGRVKSMYR